MATLRLREFVWDGAKAASNLTKHGVSFEEATTVFSDPHALEAPDHIDPERFVLIGLSARAHVLFVVHAERGEAIRIISARRASRAQRRKYEEG